MAASSASPADSGGGQIDSTAIRVLPGEKKFQFKPIIAELFRTRYPILGSIFLIEHIETVAVGRSGKRRILSVLLGDGDVAIHGVLRGDLHPFVDVKSVDVGAYVRLDKFELKEMDVGGDEADEEEDVKGKGKEVIIDGVVKKKGDRMERRHFAWIVINDIYTVGWNDTVRRAWAQHLQRTQEETEEMEVEGDADMEEVVREYDDHDIDRAQDAQVPMKGTPEDHPEPREENPENSKDVLEKDNNRARAAAKQAWVENEDDNDMEIDFSQDDGLSTDKKPNEALQRYDKTTEMAVEPPREVNKQVWVDDVDEEEEAVIENVFDFFEAKMFPARSSRPANTPDTKATSTAPVGRKIAVPKRPSSTAAARAQMEAPPPPPSAQPPEVIPTEQPPQPPPISKRARDANGIALARDWTHPSRPLKLTSLSSLNTLPYLQNWSCNVLCVVTELSPVTPSPFPPNFKQRQARIADPTTDKRVHLTVFLEPEEFEPEIGEVVLLVGVKNHRFEGGSLKKYVSEGLPPTGRWWWRGDGLRGLGWVVWREVEEWWESEMVEKKEDALSP